MQLRHERACHAKGESGEGRTAVTTTGRLHVAPGGALQNAQGTEEIVCSAL